MLPGTSLTTDILTDRASLREKYRGLALLLAFFLLQQFPRLYSKLPRAQGGWWTLLLTGQRLGIALHAYALVRVGLRARPTRQNDMDPGAG